VITCWPCASAAWAVSAAFSAELAIAFSDLDIVGVGFAVVCYAEMLGVVQFD
jgi:hypothetical protein